MWKAIVRSVEGRIGLALGGAMMAIIVFGPWLTPYAPTAIGVGPPTEPPSLRHWLGTDNLGRDVLSRFLVGGNTVLLVPLLAVGLALVLGGGLGLAGGYRPGTPFDLVVARAFDFAVTVPPLLLVMVIVGGRPSDLILIVTVALVFAPRIGRIVRGTTQAVVTNDYVAAARARGERAAAICVREIVPNIAVPVTADLALRITYGILFVATLSYLGLGVQPPSSDWGLMVAESRSFIAVAPWATLVPTLGIAALSVSFNLLADALGRHLSRMMYRGGVEL
jgi:peptide/nickel transport system permease protein